MKKFYAFAVAAALLVGAASVFAGGDGCCAAGKMKSSAKAGACADLYGKLNLTDEQKAKVTALKDECMKATSTSERRGIMEQGLAKILTPDQFAQWKTACDTGMKSGACPAMKSSGCPFMKNSQKS
jgi:Spy/CpxP family protein refolding chaperone